MIDSETTSATVNGETLRLAADCSISALLLEIGAESRHVAVMLNGNIVPRAERDTQRIYEGDHVDVVVFAAGG